MEPNESQPKPSRPKGRPRRADAPKVPWEAIDLILVHGERHIDPVTGEEVVRYPSLVELAKRHGVSRTLIWKFARRSDCYARRRQAQVATQARTDDKVIEKLSDARALATADLVRITDRYIQSFEKELQEGRVRADSVGDFDRIARLRALVIGDPDSRTEVAGGLTLTALQERHRRLRGQVENMAPELAGTTSQVGDDEDLQGREEHTR